MTLNALNLILALAVNAPHTLGQEITVTEHKLWAGKLGNLVTRSITIVKDGKTTVIEMPSFHDRFKPFPKNYNLD